MVYIISRKYFLYPYRELVLDPISLTNCKLLSLWSRLNLGTGPSPYAVYETLLISSKILCLGEPIHSRLGNRKYQHSVRVNPPSLSIPPGKGIVGQEQSLQSKQKLTFLEAMFSRLNDACTNVSVSLHNSHTHKKITDWFSRKWPWKAPILPYQKELS